MAQFTNSAALSYNGTTLRSNTVTGQLLDTVAVTKTATAEQYAPGEELAYIVTLTNSADTEVTGLTVTDDLGAYSVGTETVYPLEYQAGTLRSFVNGVPQSTPTVSAGPPLTVTGLSIPAGGDLELVYEAAPTAYASPEPGSTITNTATATGGGLSAPATASVSISAASGAQMRITKTLSPATVSPGGQLSYSFLIENSGGTPVTAADALVLSDTFDPLLSGLSVTYNGTPWAVTTNYTYDAASGAFATVPGQITLPAAQFVQETDGTWTVIPASVLCTVTGTVQPGT